MTDPIRAAFLAAIREVRPQTSTYWAERIAFTLAAHAKAELRWLDIYEAVLPEPQAGKEAP